MHSETTCVKNNLIWVKKWTIHFLGKCDPFFRLLSTKQHRMLGQTNSNSALVLYVFVRLDKRIFYMPEDGGF